jgi:hypothetical protein
MSVSDLTDAASERDVEQRPVTAWPTKQLRRATVEQRPVTGPGQSHGATSSSDTAQEPSRGVQSPVRCGATVEQRLVTGPRPSRRSLRDRRRAASPMLYVRPSSIVVPTVAPGHHCEATADSVTTSRFWIVEYHCRMMTRIQLPFMGIAPHCQ